MTKHFCTATENSPLISRQQLYHIVENLQNFFPLRKIFAWQSDKGSCLQPCGHQWFCPYILQLITYSNDLDYQVANIWFSFCSSALWQQIPLWNWEERNSFAAKQFGLTNVWQWWPPKDIWHLTKRSCLTIVMGYMWHFHKIEWHCITTKIYTLVFTSTNTKMSTFVSMY